MNQMIQTILQQLYQGQDLKLSDVTEVFSQVITGQVDDIVLSSLLTALKIKGEQPEEIAGAAVALIANAGAFARPDYEFADIVGTGGDGHNTINISSASAIVAASCGVKVAKHGNRSVSSKSGSADLFKAFDLELTMPADTARRCLDQSNLCFLFALGRFLLLVEETNKYVWSTRFLFEIGTQLFVINSILLNSHQILNGYFKYFTNNVLHHGFNFHNILIRSLCKIS